MSILGMIMLAIIIYIGYKIYKVRKKCDDKGIGCYWDIIKNEIKALY